MSSIRNRSSRARATGARYTARSRGTELLTERLAEFEKTLGADGIARRCGIGLGTVENLLSGKSEPRLSTMLRLVAGLGLRSLDDLLAPLGTTLAVGPTLGSPSSEIPEGAHTD